MWNKGMVARVKTSSHLNMKRGFTLLELLLVLGVISVVSSGVFYGYKQYQARSQITHAVEHSRLISNTLMQTYGQAGSFANLDNAAVVNGQLLPHDIPVSNNQPQNVWGGGLTLNPTDANNTSFSMTWDHVPSGACVGMSTQLSKNFPQIQVNGTDVQNVSQSQKMNISTLSSLCGGSENNKVTLISNDVSQPTTGQPPDPIGTGNVPVVPPVIPPKLPPNIVTPVIISAVAPQTYNAPNPGPAAAQVNPVVTPGTVSNATYNSTPPPITALPPQTCFPSVTNTPVNTTLYNTQTLACSAGYTGAITQQQSQVQTVTTTNTITCATNWSAPVSTITSNTTLSAWTAWVTTGNTCAQMCSTILASAPYLPNPQSQTQWVNVNPGCPTGYTGTHTYQAQQTQSRSASCANPSAAVNPVWTAWSAWANTGATQNVVNTCALTCASQLAGGGYSPNPQTQYQWVTVNQGCPAGYVGTKSYEAQQYSTRTASCANPSGTAAPTWGAWSAWANTGATQNAVNTCAATCNTQLSSGGYPVHYNYQWVTVNLGCPAGYTGQNTYEAQQVQNSSAYCANPGSTSAPTYGGWSGWSNTGATQNAINTCKPAVTCTSPNMTYQVCAGRFCSATQGHTFNTGTAVTTFSVSATWYKTDGTVAGSHTINCQQGVPAGTDCRNTAWVNVPLNNGGMGQLSMQIPMYNGGGGGGSLYEVIAAVKTTQPAGCP